MFTLEQIEEIHRKLQLFGVKDKDLPILTEQLSGNEIITVVKDGRNVQLLISQLLNFNSFTAEQLESLRGPQGNDGKDAYQTWLSQGNVGTYDDYIAVLQLPALLAAETSSIRINNKLNEADVIIEELNSLSNQTQNTLSEINIAKDLAYETVTHPPVIIDKYWHSWNHETNQYDTTYIKAEGDSAYQVWLEAGNVGTLEDYLADIKGDPFTYDDFTPEQLETLKVKGDPFLYTDFTPEQLEALKGVDGKSAYEIWLSLGNVGTEQDFINSLAAGGIDLSAYLTELEAQGLYQPIGAYLTDETDPTVPDWAKAATKPTYTAAEVGAAESVHTHTDLHTHSNKSVLDATTAAFTLADESKLDGLSNYTHPTTHSISEVSGLQAELDSKVDDSQVLTNVPAGAVFTDTIYTHPASHPASIITQDANNRFVTDAEKTAWNQKQEALGFTPENVANKKTTLTDSDTDYPTTKAVNTALAEKADTSHTHNDLLSLIYAAL